MIARAKIAVIATGAAVLLPAAAAHATTRTVYTGEPPKNIKAFNKLGAEANDFFPHGISVHLGDSVKFIPGSFHTVDFPAKGGAKQPLFSANGQKVAGVSDAAGQPFWFNGQDQYGFTPTLVKDLWGKKVSYNGKKREASGLPLQNHPKPFVVKFTRTGTFTYFCNIHPGMKGRVKVVPRTRKVGSNKKDAAVVKRAVARDLKEAKTLGKATIPAGTVRVGNEAPHGVHFYGFLPQTLHVTTGTTVTFRMPAGATDEHTATTGPGNPETEPNSYLGQIAASFQGSPVFDPRGVYPSDPAGTPASLTPTTHGNGFWNSGVMDVEKSTPQTPSFNTVKFTAPGTYQFFCMIHPFMHGTVVVQ